MLTTLQIPRVLERHCGGRREVRLPARNVRGLLDELQRSYPELHRCICNETGAVRPHLHLYVNNQFLSRPGGLDTPLQPGDVVSVFQAVSGG